MIECANCGEPVDELQLAMLAGNRAPRALCEECWALEMQIAVAKCGLAMRASNKVARICTAAFDRLAATMTRAWFGGGRDPDDVVRELLDDIEVDEDE